MATDVTPGGQPHERPRLSKRAPGNESGGVGFAAPYGTWRSGMVNVEISDEAGPQRVLMARFPRTKVALGSGLGIVVILGLPWLIVPFVNIGHEFPAWALSLAAVLVLVLVFGWILVPSLMIAVRGGYLALTPTGVLIDQGLSSVLIPWAAIKSAGADTSAMDARYPVLRLGLRSDRMVPGWPWLAVLSPALLGSSRRTLRIPAWWLQPVPLDWLVALVRFLLAHPGERQRIGDVDPDAWALAPTHK